MTGLHSWPSGRPKWWNNFPRVGSFICLH